MNCLTAEILKKDLIVSQQPVRARIVNFIEEEVMCHKSIPLFYENNDVWFIFSTKN